MAAILAGAGFCTIWCTPHRIAGVYDTPPGEIRAGVEELQKRISRAGIVLTLKPATEYCLDEFLVSTLSHPLMLDESLLLVELPRTILPKTVSEVLYQMIRNGTVPLIAHPERSPVFSPEDDPAQYAGFSALSAVRSLFSKRKKTHAPLRETNLPPLLTLLRDMGCRFQGNIGSFAGIYGPSVQRTALQYLRAGVYDRLGSDAHRPDQLGTWLPEGLGVVRECIGPAGLKRLLRHDRQKAPVTV